MDFDLILYIALIIGTVVWSAVKKLKEEDKKQQTKKNIGRPVTVEPDSEAEVRPTRSHQQKTRVVNQPEANEEYFSYETMSERDFEQAFAENATSESDTVIAQKTEKTNINLSLDEEEVYKGVVWSEILKRKY